MDGIAEASPRFKARMAGVCELLEALTATFGQVIVRGRLVVAGNAAATAANFLGHERLFWLGFVSSLMGVAFHLAWALRMYELPKPVNRSLSLLAAFFILVGCAMQALTTFLYLAPLLILRRQLRKRIYAGAVAGAGAPVSQIESIRLQHRPRIFRTMVRSHRLPHFQVHLPASNSGSAVGDQRSGLCHLSVPAARILSVHPLHRCRVRSRGNTTGAMADRDGRERPTMEGAGQRSGDADMRAVVCSRYGLPR